MSDDLSKVDGGFNDEEFCPSVLQIKWVMASSQGQQPNSETLNSLLCRDKAMARCRSLASSLSKAITAKP